MKNLITSIASLLILLAILMEFTHSQVLFSRIMAADQAVNTFREAVREEGCVSEHSKRRIREELAEILKCDEKEVEVGGTGQTVLRGQLIFYSIKAPVGDVLAMPLFWNIGEEESRADYQVRQYVTSAFYSAGDGGDDEGEGDEGEERGEKP